MSAVADDKVAGAILYAAAVLVAALMIVPLALLLGPRRLSGRAA